MNDKKSSFLNLCKSVRRRWGMYTPVLLPDQMRQPSLILGGFLTAVCDEKCFFPPREVRFNIVDEHFILYAEGGYFRLSKLIRKSDWNNETISVEKLLEKIFPMNDETEEFASLIHLLALVCLSDFCELDISYDSQTHFRQIFIEGNQASDGILRLDDESPKSTPYIRLSLTPSLDIFEGRYLNTNATLQYLDKLLSVDYPPLPALNTIVNKQTNYELDIAFQPNK
ncbi:MAG: hypothetical protein H6657_12135 [Ardenticatenaceae bacterium]|nr:hypothetical protein [Ardenticatenaceae bacterium]